MNLCLLSLRIVIKSEQQRKRKISILIKLIYIQSIYLPTQSRAAFLSAELFCCVPAFVVEFSPTHEPISNYTSHFLFISIARLFEYGGQAESSFIASTDPYDDELLMINIGNLSSGLRAFPQILKEASSHPLIFDRVSGQHCRS